MNDNTKKTIYKYLISFGTLVGLSLILWGLIVLGNFIREDSLKKGIALVLKESQYSEKYHNLNLTRMKNKSISSNISMETIWIENTDKTKIEIYILPMIGKYGIFDGVFVFDKYNKAEFCGIIVDDFSKQYQYYGISETAIERGKQKINTFKNEGGI